MFMRGFQCSKKFSATDGGATLFGVDGVIVKAHGSSDGYAFSNAIAQARTVLGNVIGK